jgi:nucleotide-binding universal stress UspA family protein
VTSSPAAPVVVGVDGSPGSLRALDWAAREAATRQSRLHVLHAFLWPLMHVPLGPSDLGPPDGGLRNAAVHILTSAADRARRAAPALDVSTDLPVCAPAAALIEASHDAGLVVVGHRGLGRFTGLLVGSVGVQTAASRRVSGHRPSRVSSVGRCTPAGVAAKVLRAIGGRSSGSWRGLAPTLPDPRRTLVPRTTHHAPIARAVSGWAPMATQRGAA